MLGSAPRLLLVDDDESSRLLLVQVLSSWGYAVAQARGGAEALRRLRQGSFDAVLTDLEMPVVTGFVLARQIRVQEVREGRPRMPILAFSGHASLATRRECVRLGFDRVLSKPFDWDAVWGALGGIEGGRRIPRPLEVCPEIRSLLPSFFAARQADLSRMVSALANREFEEIDRLGHRLKGSGGTFGFPELSRIGGLLEVASRAGDAERCAQALDALGVTLRDAVSRAA